MLSNGKFHIKVVIFYTYKFYILFKIVFKKKHKSSSINSLTIFAF